MPFATIFKNESVNHDAFDQRNRIPNYKSTCHFDENAPSIALFIAKTDTGLWGIFYDFWMTQKK